MSTTAPQPLPGGLVLRPARPADLDGIGALLADRGEPADAVDHRLVVLDEEAGFDACAVVVDGDRVVSTATLLDEVVTIENVTVPAGQVELVATDRAYEGRGLVRALMDWAHRRSARRGHVVQVMLGIPYFYRQFGYSYAIPVPRQRPVVSVPEPETGHVVRRATPDDIPVMNALQHAAQRHADLRMPHSTACWRWLVARDGSSQWVVERGGTIVATGRTTPPEEGVRLAEVAAVAASAARALLAHACAVAHSHGSDTAVTVTERQGQVLGVLGEFLGPPDDTVNCYYVRAPDAAVLLDRLRPVLGARLRRSRFAAAEGEALVSFFRAHVRFRYSAGEVGNIVAGPTMQAPAARGGAGVAPDLFASLVFGPRGIDGLAALHPDVYPGPDAELMTVLFPPVTSDLLTFYLP